MSITSDKVRIPWRAAVSLALCLVALSPVAAENALVTGIGNQTCAYWQSSPDHQAEGVGLDLRVLERPKLCHQPRSYDRPEY